MFAVHSKLRVTPGAVETESVVHAVESFAETFQWQPFCYEFKHRIACQIPHHNQRQCHAAFSTNHFLYIFLTQFGLHPFVVGRRDQHDGECLTFTGQLSR